MRSICRLALAGIALSLVACEGPHVAIQAPADATVIDHHGEVPIAITITGDDVKRVELDVDGAPTMFPPDLDPAPPSNGDCSDGCAGTLHWVSDEATVGTHAIDISAYDGGGATGGAAPLALVFQDHLAAALTSPRSPTSEARARSRSTPAVPIAAT